MRFLGHGLRKEAPRDRTGRPSKSLTLAQAQALLKAAESARLYAYIIVSLLSGLRTEEVRAFIWDYVVTWVDDATAGALRRVPELLFFRIRRFLSVVGGRSGP